MADRMAVYLDGYASETEQELINTLSRASRTDTETLKRLLQSGPVRLADSADTAAAERLRRYLAPYGAKLRFETETETAEAPPPPGVPRSLAGESGGPEPRPLNFRRRLGWAFGIVRRNLVTLLALTGLVLLSGLIVPAAMMLGFGLQVATLFSGAAAGLPLMALAGSPLALLGTFGGMLLFILAVFSLYTAIIQVPAFSMANGDRARVGEVLKSGLARTPDFITAIGIAALVPLPLQVIAGASGYLLSGSMLNTAVQVSVVVGLAWISLSLALVAPVVALERLAPVPAIRRAWRLMQGLRLRLFGNSLLLMLVVLGGTLLASAPMLLLKGGSSAGMPLLGLLITLGVTLLTLAFMFAGLFFVVNFYFEARVLKEGWQPPWVEAPDDSWPLSTEVPEPPGGRGWRAWGELALFTLVTLVLMGLIIWMVPSPLMTQPPVG